VVSVASELCVLCVYFLGHVAAAEPQQQLRIVVVMVVVVV
jgi:hypothetical protein